MINIIMIKYHDTFAKSPSPNIAGVISIITIAIDLSVFVFLLRYSVLFSGDFPLQIPSSAKSSRNLRPDHQPWCLSTACKHSKLLKHS